MDKDKGSNTLTDAAFKELRAVVMWVKGAIKAKIPGGDNSATGPTFPDLRVAKTPNIRPNDVDLPRGQYKYQVFQMVSQNETGWDVVRAAPTIP